MKHVNSRDPRKATIVAALRAKVEAPLHAGRVTNVAETPDGGFEACVFVKAPGDRGYGISSRMTLTLDEFTAANRTRIHEGLAAKVQLQQQREAQR